MLRVIAAVMLGAMLLQGCSEDQRPEFPSWICPDEPKTLKRTSWKGVRVTSRARAGFWRIDVVGPSDRGAYVFGFDLQPGKSWQVDEHVRSVTGNPLGDPDGCLVVEFNPDLSVPPPDARPEESR